ncbi:MAG: bile acid:sodium symporter family protein, partial [Sphingomonadales bacterium]
MLRTVTNNFAILTVLGVALAWFFPAGFTWMTDGRISFAGQPLLSLALGLIMLAMGLTLTFEDYRGLTRMPKALLAGVGLQFAVMPLSGF